MTDADFTEAYFPGGLFPESISGAKFGHGKFAINDGCNLYHSSNSRDISRYGLALLADGGIMAGAILKNKVGVVPLFASLAGRAATEFIPNRQVIESEQK